MLNLLLQLLCKYRAYLPIEHTIPILFLHLMFLKDHLLDYKEQLGKPPGHGQEKYTAVHV